MTRDILLRLHRWVALALAPLFLIVLVSGGLLEWEPILGRGETSPRRAVDAVALTVLLQQSTWARRAERVEVEPDGGVVALGFERGAPEVRLNVATGAVLPPTPRGLFAWLHDLHEDLLLDAKIVVETAAWAMLLISITGPLLAWPRLRPTLPGWHIGIGWILMPLVLLPPATEALRTLGVGRTPLPQVLAAGPEITMGEALARAARSADLSALESMRRRPGGMLLRTGQGADAHAWMVSNDSVRDLGAGRDWLRALHDGTWAPPYSGWLGLTSAAALLGLVGTGALAWGRRRLSERRRQSDSGADLLVAYASQTGTAARYAEATAVAMREGGARVAVASLAALTPADLGHYRATLLVASTTGEGQLAETGRQATAKASCSSCLSP